MSAAPPRGLPRDTDAPARPRLGFIGLGWIGAARMQALAESDAAEIAGLLDSAPENLRAAGARAPGAVMAPDLESLLALDLDGVVIATYMEQVFARRPMRSVQDIREATVEAGRRRIRPSLMTALLRLSMASKNSCRARTRSSVNCHSGPLDPAPASNVDSVSRTERMARSNSRFWRSLRIERMAG